MPAPTTAELTEPIQFPADPGVPIWEERRAVPVVTVYGAPLAFTAMLAFMAGPLLVKAPLALGAAVLAVVLARARRRALIETFVVTDRFVTLVKPGGGRVALPTAAITALTVTGDKVRIDSTLGVVTLGFVRRQKGLVRALQQVCPTLQVDRDMAAFCST